MKSYHRNSIPKILFLFFIIVSLIGIITNPSLSLSSASSGLSIWFNIVIPSLLPFLIISEILIGLGFVDFIGKLLSPLMGPLFNLPGEGAFPISMAVISGYPVGAKLTSRLREEKLITRIEANRLIAFTSTSGPLFMLGAVSIGMLQDPKIAPLILIPHYLSVVILGFIFSFYSSQNNRFISKNDTSVFEEIRIAYIIWLNTKKSIGSLISKSIKESMDTIILIGGLVIFYSVLVEVVFNMNFFKNFLFHISNTLSVDATIIKGFISGFFEVTIGCKNIAATNTSLINKILIINFLIGWSGLSVHSQSLSFINNTDINSKIYIISKFFHGILSTILSYLIYLIRYKNYIQPTFIESKLVFKYLQISDWMHLLINSTKLAISMGLYILVISIFAFIIFRFLKNVLIRSS